MTLATNLMAEYWKQQQNTGYVKDGLIFWLDGIQNTRTGHSATTTVWEDLSGNNYDVTAYGTVSLAEDHVVFGGGQFRGTSDIQNNDIGQVEVVIRPDDIGSAGIVACGYDSVTKRKYAFAEDGSLAFGSTDAATGGFGGSLLPQTAVYSSADFTSSAEYYANGKIVPTAKIADYWNHTGGAECPLTIGSRRSSNSLVYMGRIYCIRIYNRPLTADEVAHNYSIDKARFKLS